MHVGEYGNVVRSTACLENVGLMKGTLKVDEEKGGRQGSVLICLPCAVRLPRFTTWN